MYTEEVTKYSQILNRDMHMMIYGHDGVPFLAFPTQDSKCHNYEDFGMIRELSDYLENERGIDEYGYFMITSFHIQERQWQLSFSRTRANCSLRMERST